ncbi:hypothetical protein ACA910_004418 [Epithemia clementina (nom. ined.)]
MVFRRCCLPSAAVIRHSFAPSTPAAAIRRAPAPNHGTHHHVHSSLPSGVFYHTSSAAKGEERVVVLGSGWGGFQLALNMNKNIPLTVVSPNNHFVFTPLLPSASVGTLECRCIQEPIRTILGPKGKFVHARAQSLDTVNKLVHCESVHSDKFSVEYDKLVIAVGVQTNTFGIPSIQHDSAQGIFFLKQLAHARAIRTNIIDSFEKAAIPTVSEAERKRLLSFLVVGGGPTSCEFTSELHDFVKHDVKRLYRDLVPHVKITVVEAGPSLLGPFDKALQEYALGLFKNRDIDVRLGTAVLGVEDFIGEGYHFPAKRALLSDGDSLEFGTMVWSAGLAPTEFVQNLGDANSNNTENKTEEATNNTNDPIAKPTTTTIIERHPRTKRILVDNYLRVKGHEGSIWAIGDAAVNESGVPLPQLAQVARQEGIYLAKVLNGKLREDEKPFEFFSLGSMAFMGDLKGIYDGSSVGKLKDPRAKKEEQQRQGEGSNQHHPPALKGFMALLLWRFAYWGRQTSMVNKILIPMYWFKAFLFGRDISRY